MQQRGLLMPIEARLDRWVRHDRAVPSLARSEACWTQLLAEHYPDGLFSAADTSELTPNATV